MFRRAMPFLAVLTALGALAACGDDDEAGDSSAPSSTQAADEPAADYDEDGVLRIATNLEQMDFQVDDLYAFGTQNDLGVLYHVLGAPLRLTADGGYEPFLAESYEIVDESTVVLQLREGLTFHDGAPYDAQTLADAMLGYQAAPPTQFRGFMLDKVTSIEVGSDTELTFKLSEPVALQFLDTLANPPALVVSPGSTPEAPVGAGPFRVTEFVPGDRLYVEKWDDFFAADEYLLAGVEWLNIPQPEAAQNALRGGQVDLIATNPADVDALLNLGSFESVVTENQGHLMLATCRTGAPFDDPKFREAFDLAIDREQLSEVVFRGYAKPMESFWNEGAALSVPDLIDTDGDLERAKELLEEIGWDDSRSIFLGLWPGFPVHMLMAEALSGQLERAGINVEITVMDSRNPFDYVTPETGGAWIIANVNAGVRALQVPGLPPASAWNVCAEEDPELKALTDPLAAGGMGEGEVKSGWEDAQRYVVENHLWYPLTGQPAVYVYDADQVQGIQEGIVGLTGSTSPSLYLAGVSIAP